MTHIEAAPQTSNLDPPRKSGRSASIAAAEAIARGNLPAGDRDALRGLLDEFDAAESKADDDDDHVFASAYDSALREELRGTRVLPEGGVGGPVVVEGGEGLRAEGDGPEDETDDRANQVKEDVAIIESILTSVKLQEGAPGPATNLMGMLGVSIPRGTLESREDKKKDLG